jgi:RimJ/RimL family protein N-acetyltransferase
MATAPASGSAAAQPLGPLVDATAAREPKPVVLHGRFGRLEKLDAARYVGDLWQAVEGHDPIWTYLPYGPFPDRQAFAIWLKARAGIPDPFSYVIVDQSGRAAGIMALMAVRPEMRVIEVGNIVLSPQLQRTTLATEAQFLLARYVFETLGYRRYEWKCDSRNAASRRAALRLGFTFEGLSWQHMIVKGRNRDTAWYAMLDGDWPAQKLAFERWLALDNFDAEGRQKQRLADSSRPRAQKATTEGA